MAICWSDHRSNGSQIKTYKLWRKRCQDREEARYHDDTIATLLTVKVREEEWELLSTIELYDRSEYPKHGRFPPSLDLGVCVMHRRYVVVLATKQCLNA